MFQFILHCLQAGLSGYVLYHASISIPNLQKYESKSKKAAKYSSTAAEQLQRTRSTQTVGAVAGVFSSVTSILLALHIISSGPKSLMLNVAAGLATAGASVHMGHFWDDKGKVPLIQDYNDAVDSSKTIRGQLALLGLLWGASSFFAIFNVL